MVDNNEQEDDVVIQGNQSINDDDGVIEEEDDDIENRDDIDSEEDEGKEESDSKVAEDKNEFIPDVVILQDQIININHYLDHYNEVGTPFFSNKIKKLSKKLKQNNYLNIVKLVSIFGNNNEGFMNITKQNHDNICKVIQSNYSESDAAQKVNNELYNYKNEFVEKV